jgi:hypothetical protein
MTIRRALATAALGLVFAASLASSSSADTPPLSASVTPADISDGPVRLAFIRTAFNRNGGTSKATMETLHGRAELHIDRLEAPALVHCTVATEEDARISVSEYFDGGQGYGETGQSLSLPTGQTKVEFIAEPNPSGDYMYTMRADAGAWTLTQCTVESL